MNSTPDTSHDSFDDSDDYDYEPSEPREDPSCSHCKQPTCGEWCGFCGVDLCPFCFSAGGGFCGGRHTQSQIDAYEDVVMGPPSADKLRHRQARNELQAMGILPKP